MKDKKLTQRMWDVLTQWIGDTIVVDEYIICIRSIGNPTVIWVSIVFKGSLNFEKRLESKDIGETDIPIEVLDLLKKAFELKSNGGSYLNSNSYAEIPVKL